MLEIVLSSKSLLCRKCLVLKKFNKVVILMCYVIGRKLVSRNNFGDF